MIQKVQSNVKKFIKIIICLNGFQSKSDQKGDGKFYEEHLWNNEFGKRI